ncbi:hypothetical protein [Planctellipticum variicoloris]|uniref:hypothetical protein n=1 Tax=Planctellipticum variicoloris TaxID=3064265 RepID=UPI003013F83D|nr:hypothetical protein SH412_001561 [Planctomycetaceae bacterium SH412]
MNGMAWTYLIYLGLCVAITIWVARTLRRNGVTFLTRVGNDAEPDAVLADALSHLLIVGFYLVNLGVISFLMRSEQRVVDAQESIELLSSKVGMILVVLGAMHFAVLAVFAAVRNHATVDDRPPLRRHSVSELTARRQAFRDHASPSELQFDGPVDDSPQGSRP